MPPTDPIDPAARELVTALTTRARAAARELALLPRGRKDEALRALADALVDATDEIVAANGRDVERETAAGMRPNLIDRLTLGPDRVAAAAQGLRDVAGLPDPVGDVVRGSTSPTGLQVRQVRVPMGVVGMIYEARPNVTVDAAGLALKSGNAAILRGGSAAEHTNRVLVAVMRRALATLDITPDAVQLLDAPGRDAVRALMTARGEVDLLIPRGGAGLIQTVVTESTVPTIETGVGNCHVYVDAAADLEMAERIVLNAKTHRTSVCNAAESLLVHQDVAPQALPRLLGALGAAGVTIHAEPSLREVTERAGATWVEATDDDWAAEYLSLDLAVRVVPSLDEALDHVRRWSSGHTDAIVTADRAAARRWVTEVDSAAVMVNASTRFTDGAELGFGAEIGISTQKLHARGPMALQELTSTKWVVEGDGQVRA
ncbi:glutamate-5-semialdehyde dehydrogenase [Arsenicicoccus sp. oral taxon 190]|uniref:glutamate-5-semialdehyde dehydrogenase n=1 Tax=Arsenicicoccus sp. oral taxon 190 TaxID=1658671 RepID=UPI00067A325C|nr:glutamate-5-semialdehyde dehydrogenase [Arsenicicoccus sp. oral taxon 190]AKT51579.1 gamma-glutamyl phosphate reductase [Arsenicicoccus sp. oral taxon 190]